MTENVVLTCINQKKQTLFRIIISKKESVYRNGGLPETGILHLFS